jgi:hypothetical protein
VDEGANDAPSSWTASEFNINQSSNIYGGSTSPDSLPKPGTMAITGDPSWDSIRISAHLSSTDDDAIGIVFRYKDANNYYRFSMDRKRSYRRLIKKFNGTINMLWQDNFAYNQNQSYHLTIELYADRIIGYLDNIFIFSVQDGEIRNGMLGFYCWANAGARFEELQVESLESPPLLWQPLLDNLEELSIVDETGSTGGPSQWSAVDGVLSQSSDIHAPDTSPAKVGTYAVGGSTGWRDIQISVRLRSDDDDDAIGVMFRYQDANNYYRFSMDRERSYRRLIKKVGGTVTVLWEDSVQFDIGQDYDLTLYVVGYEIRGHINGVQIFLVQDPDLKRGQIALYCWANSGAHFERLIVIDQTRRIGRWSLRDEGGIGGPSIWKVDNGALHQTSDIYGGSVSGTDPIKPGTYAVAGDITWTDYRLIVQLRSDDDDAIGVMFRYIDDKNYYRFSMDSQHKYRRLVKKVDGVVTTLWEDSNGYAVGELFTLTVDVIGTRLMGYQGDTRLFDILDGSHPSGRIGLYGWANDGMRFEKVAVRLPPQEAYAIFRDRFRNEDTTAWTIVDEGTDSGPSNWTTFQGSLRQTSNIYSPPIDRDTLDKQGTHALAGDSSWSDLIITAQLQSFDDDAIGLLFRYSDENHYYRFSMDSQHKYRRLVKKVGSVVTLLWEDGFAYEVGRPYRITIVAVGNILRGYIDGIPVFVVKDSDLTSGKIGLYSWANMDARFSDVHVYPSDQLFENWLFDEPFDIIRPDVWNFVDEGDQQGPSHWDVADGALHQTSDIFGGSLSDTDPIKPGTYAVAGDITWTDYRLIVQLRSDDDDAIGVMFRYQDANNYYRFSMDRERSYRRLIKKVGGTVTVLWEDSVQFDIGQDYMLTIDCIGAQLYCYLNGVELFTIKDDELNSGKIGLYSWANTGARFANLRILATSWSTYYEFEEDEGLHPAGTQFKILAGNAASAPSAGSNAVRRFIASMDEHGQIKLHRSGTDLRIMSDRDSQEHVRHFLSEADYSSLSVKVLRKGDGTGFFIFLPAAVPTGSLLPMGQYRLRMIYRRNNSALDPGSQVLSQAGINEPESIVLDVPWKTI